MRFRELIKRKLGGELIFFFKNSSWVFIANFIASICMFLKSVVLGRLLGVELFGIFLLIGAFVMTVQEFFNLNIGTALIKFGADYINSENKEKFVALVKLCFIFTAITAVLSVLFVYVISHFGYSVFIKEPGLKIYIIAYAAATSLGFFSYISQSLLRLFFKFKLNSLIRILSSFIEVISVVVVLYLYPKNLPILLITVVIILFLQGIFINGWALWELRDEIKPYLNAPIRIIRADWRKIRNFVLFNSASRTIKNLTSSGDILILGALSGPIQVGYYGVAKKLAFIILRFTDPMSNAIYPQTASLVSQKKYTDLKKMVIKITKIVSPLLLIFFIFLLFSNKWLISTLYGHDFSSSSSPFLFLFVAASLSAIFFWTTPIIFSLGKVNIRLIAYITALLVGASIAVILIPSYGATGVAIAFLITRIIEQSIFLYVAKKELK